MLTSSIFALVGVILGAILTFVLNKQLKQDEYKTRINEKIIDKRINAHEAILEMSKLLRTTISKQSISETGQLQTYVGMIANKETFENFKTRYYELENFNNHWLDPELNKYTFFIQEYLMNLDLLLKDIDEKHYPDIGQIIKPDFLDFSHRLEESAVKFLTKGIYDYKKEYYEKESYYDLNTTNEMFRKTKLSENYKKLKEKYIGT